MATTQNTYTGDGSTTDYILTFPYLAVADVRVSLDDIGTTAFSLINATTLRFNSAPGNGVAIRIYRVTDDSNNKIVFNTGSSIKADDLNDAVNRFLFIAQELKGNISSLTAGDVADGSLVTIKLADDSVTDNKLSHTSVVPGSYTLADITVNQQGRLTSASSSTIGTNDIDDNVITEAKVFGNNGFVPTGAVFHFAASSIPSGYLKCNGDTIPNGSGTVQGVTANFAALYALVGSTLPDLRGEFIRGLDDGRGVDNNRGIATAQGDQNRQHDHTATSTVTDPGHRHGVSAARDIGGNTDDGGAPDERVTEQSFNTSSATTGITVTTTMTTDGGSEARPRNVALLACIKY